MLIFTRRIQFLLEEVANVTFWPYDEGIIEKLEIQLKGSNCFMADFEIKSILQQLFKGGFYLEQQYDELVAFYSERGIIESAR